MKKLSAILILPGLYIVSDSCHLARKSLKKVDYDDSIFRATDKIKNNPTHISSLEILRQAFEQYKLDNDIVFYTDDLCLKVKADSLGLPCERFEFGGKIDLYKGYKEVILTDEELAQYYEKPKNKWNLLINEYIIILTITVINLPNAISRLEKGNGNKYSISFEKKNTFIIVYTPKKNVIVPPINRIIAISNAVYIYVKKEYLVNKNKIMVGIGVFIKTTIG